LRFTVVGLFLTGCVTLEILLRTVAGFGNPLLYTPDPSCGYITRPNQQLSRFGAHVELNTYGLRCPDFTPEKPPNTTRMLLLGDSLVYGTTLIDQNDIFSERIRQKLEKLSTSYSAHNERKTPGPLRRVEIINASANGWAISNEAGFLYSRGTFGSDYVIEVINSGDLAQPFATIEDTPAAVTSKPISAISDVIAHLIHRHAHDPGTTVKQDGAQTTANLNELSRMADFIRQHNAQMAVVYLPFRTAIESGASAPVTLVSWARATRTPLLDLTNDISRYPTSSVTNLDRTHLNAFGNQVVADALTPYLNRLSGDLQANTVSAGDARAHAARHAVSHPGS
jgi:hypothetical protein